MSLANTNTSHFLLFPIPAWGKNYRSSLWSFKQPKVANWIFHPIGHIRPLCTLATRLVRERENIIVTLIVAPHVLDKTQSEVSRQFLDDPSEKSKALQQVR